MVTEFAHWCLGDLLIEVHDVTDKMKSSKVLKKSLHCRRQLGVFSKS